MAAKKQQPIHADHRARMQERVRQNGLESLAEHEVLEYLLFFSIPRKDTNALAHTLIQHFGSFCNVLQASEEELLKVDGIGPASARLLHTFLPVSRFYSLKKRVKRPNLSNPDAAAEYLRPLFYGETEEIFYLIALDNKYAPLRDIQVARGLPDKVSFDPQLLTRRALGSGCSCALLAHNHPSGLAIPSEGDFRTTCAIVASLGAIGVDVVDHVIIADHDACSMQKSGRMPHYDPLTRQVQY